jgi:hypothetical protein
MPRALRVCVRARAHARAKNIFMSAVIGLFQYHRKSQNFMLGISKIHESTQIWYAPSYASYIIITYTPGLEQQQSVQV